MKLMLSIAVVLFLGTSVHAADVVRVMVSKNVVNEGAKKIKVGDTLAANAIVVGTSTDSILQLQWSENKVVFKGKFKMNIETLNEKKEPTLLSLAYGSMRSSVKKTEVKTEFKVKTPAAVAGVRGTDFMVSYNELLGETEVICFESEIDFQESAKTSKGKIVKQGQWGGYGGRFSEAKTLIDLPESVLNHFKTGLSFK